MVALKGLTGISEETKECKFFEKPVEINKILKKGLVATAAGDNGAINIWTDDDGFIRCQSMRHCFTIDEQIFTKISEVRTWATEWIEKIR